MLPHRMERVAEAVREILAEIIQDSLKDPGIPAVFTLTRVEVTRDLQHARVHYSQLPDDDAALAASAAALRRARSFLRGELGRRMPIKYLPDLEFFFDPSARHAQRVQELLDAALRPPAPEPPPAPQEPSAKAKKASKSRGVRRAAAPRKKAEKAPGDAPARPPARRAKSKKTSTEETS